MRNHLTELDAALSAFVADLGAGLRERHRGADLRVRPHDAARTAPSAPTTGTASPCSCSAAGSRAAQVYGAVARARPTRRCSSTAASPRAPTTATCSARCSPSAPGSGRSAKIFPDHKPKPSVWRTPADPPAPCGLSPQPRSRRGRPSRVGRRSVGCRVTTSGTTVTDHPILPREVVDSLFAPDLPEVGHWEERYPPRELAEGAHVTRFAPSPTGYVHIGGIYTAMICQDVSPRVRRRLHHPGRGHRHRPRGRRRAGAVRPRLRLLRPAPRRDRPGVDPGQRRRLRALPAVAARADLRDLRAAAAARGQGLRRLRRPRSSSPTSPPRQQAAKVAPGLLRRLVAVAGRRRSTACCAELDEGHALRRPLPRARPAAGRAERPTSTSSAAGSSTRPTATTSSS